MKIGDKAPEVLGIDANGNEVSYEDVLSLRQLVPSEALKPHPHEVLHKDRDQDNLQGILCQFLTLLLLSRRLCRNPCHVYLEEQVLLDYS